MGVRRLLEDLKREKIRPALAIIGEPTEMRVVGAHKAGSVIETIAKGRNNRMPAWGEFLGPGKVHVLAAYVWSLGGE